MQPFLTSADKPLKGEGYYSLHVFFKASQAYCNSFHVIVDVEVVEINTIWQRNDYFSV